MAAGQSWKCLRYEVKLRFLFYYFQLWPAAISKSVKLGKSYIQSELKGMVGELIYEVKYQISQLNILKRWLVKIVFPWVIVYAKYVHNNALQVHWFFLISILDFQLLLLKPTLDFCRHGQCFVRFFAVSRFAVRAWFCFKKTSKKPCPYVFGRFFGNFQPP